MDRGLRACMAISACAGLGLVPAAARADEARSQSFASTGYEQVFVVPAGVTNTEVTLVGASGGTRGITPGGMGASVVGTLSVTPGEQLFVEVGGDGSAFEPGYNGGGPGVQGSGSGGGASDVRTCSVSVCAEAASLDSRLLVAAGGGGAGRDGLAGSAAEGGEGGGAGDRGQKGSPDGPAKGGLGGGGAETSAGGAAGMDSSGAPAETGTLGRGGEGGEGGYGYAGGGGGGGGIYGGGGGGGGLYETVGMTPHNGAGGGGGGGSSGAPSGASGVTLLSSALTSEAPTVTIAWTAPTPAAVTGEPASVTGTSATLTGTVNPDLSAVTECHFVISPAPPAGASIPCLQQVGSGGTPVAVTAAVSGLAPSRTYTVTLAAANAQGSASGSPVTFPTPGAASGAGAGLSVTNLELSPTRFRRGRRTATITAVKLASATRITFTLSEAATTTLSFEQAKAGVLVGRVCRAPAKARGKAHPCKRFSHVAGGVKLSAPAGVDKVAFDGVLTGGGSLAPGTYRVSLTATAGTIKAMAAQHPSFMLLAP
jgi:hypothetical protein